MTQFTANEVRDAITWKYGDKSTRISAMLTAFADLLEAREKAVPVMVVNHVSSAEHDLPIGMKLYTHPSPADAERLAEALRDARDIVLAFLGDVAADGSRCGMKQAVIKNMFASLLDRLAAHSAQAQPPAASVTDGLIDALRHQRQIDECGDEVGVSRQAVDEAIAILTMLAAALQAAALQPQAVQPVAWVNPDDLHNPNFVGVNAVKVGHEGLGKHYTLPLYTHPQPAQDAALYQELLMAVSKKFPNESRHETALRYIKQTELQACEPKCDAAMAKESGR